MNKGMSSQEFEIMKDSMDECAIQSDIWSAIKKLEPDKLSQRNPLFKKEEKVQVGNNYYIVNDYCEINKHYVYLLAVAENSVYHIIAIESMIKETKIDNGK